MCKIGERLKLKVFQKNGGVSCPAPLLTAVASAGVKLSPLDCVLGCCELCLFSGESRAQAGGRRGFLLRDPSWDGTGDHRAAPPRQVPSSCPLCLPGEALPCPRVLAEESACAFRSWSPALPPPASLGFQLSKQRNLWSPAGTLLFVSPGHPRLLCAGRLWDAAL